MKKFASSEQKVRRRVSPVQSKELQADARRQLLERRLIFCKRATLAPPTRKSAKPGKSSRESD